MREILFRGKRTDNGEWLEGYLHKIDGIGKGYRAFAIQVQDIDSRMCRPHSHEVISETVGQFTGLTDKNGKKIFEGDILELLQISSRDKKDEIPEKIILYVAYGADGYPRLYSTNEKGSIPFFYWNYREIKVIGNIHDNPELLEELQNG